MGGGGRGGGGGGVFDMHFLVFAVFCLFVLFLFLVFFFGVFGEKNRKKPKKKTAPYLKNISDEIIFQNWGFPYKTNGISYKLNSHPVLFAGDTVDAELECPTDADGNPSCPSNDCVCMHRREIQLGNVVDFVWYNFVSLLCLKRGRFFFVDCSFAFCFVFQLSSSSSFFGRISPAVEGALLRARW